MHKQPALKTDLVSEFGAPRLVIATASRLCHAGSMPGAIRGVGENREGTSARPHTLGGGESAARLDVFAGAAPVRLAIVKTPHRLLAVNSQGGPAWLRPRRRHVG